MATSTIVLSSSPPHSPIAITPPHFKNGAMSSSPTLPSPSRLFSNMPSQLSSGSRAAPVPKDAVVGFASASTLLRQARFEGQGTSDSTAQRLGLVDRFDMHDSSQTISQIKKGAVATENEKPPLFRKPKVLQAEHSVVDQGKAEREKEHRATSDAKVKGDIVPKKPRKKKNKGEDEGQTTIKKTKITKPGSSKTGSSSSKNPTVQKQAKAKVSETFNTLLPSQEEDARAREEFRDLCLEKAIPLRRQWTPCRDTVQARKSENATESPSSVTLTDPPLANIPPVARFGQLLGDFGLAKQETPTTATFDVFCQDAGETVLKKRKVEIVQGIPVPPQGDKSKRTRSPKRKPRTITEKATAPFVLTDETAEPSLLQYFSQLDTSLEVPLCNLNTRTSVSVDNGHRLPVNKTPKLRVVAPKGKTQKQPTLLSPESAMKYAGDQEMVFGTSSQLAREESPTLIRNLQQAIQESTTVSQMSQELGASILPAGKFRTSTALAQVQTRNLWSSASRDLEGSLLKVETVDLSKTPKPVKDSVEITYPPRIQARMTLQPHINEPEDTPSVRNSSNKEVDTLKPVREAAPIPQEVQESTLVIPRSVAEATLRKRPGNRSPTKNATNSKADPNQMPNYQGFTDAQLSKEVSAYGFKTIKKRKAMIDLLEECWKSKVSMALQEAQANLNIAKPTTISEGSETPKLHSPGKKRGRHPKNTTTASVPTEGTENAPAKKPRGRPKKDLSAATPTPKKKRKESTSDASQSGNADTVADEIYDSSLPTPSPPRRHPSSTSPRQLQLTPRAKAPKEKGTRPPEKDRTQLFDQITKIITSFPPTHDPKDLTFHERILMYEPIVIEDLAAWLNGRGVSVEAENKKVFYGLVKEWCESKSVCCLWRENLRGGNRVRR